MKIVWYLWGRKQPYKLLNLTAIVEIDVNKIQLSFQQIWLSTYVWWSQSILLELGKHPIVPLHT